MKTRLFVVLFCLVWALGCGNRDPDDVETGFGAVETATLRICNDRNCFGGDDDGIECTEDAECGDGGECRIIVPLKECFGGTARLGTACEDAEVCGVACDAGPLEGDECTDTKNSSDCKACEGGSVPDSQCTADADCGGECFNGTRVADRGPCLEDIGCGGTCVGGVFDGLTCTDLAFCADQGGVCSLDPGKDGVNPVECRLTGACVQSGECKPGECNEVDEGCVDATTELRFSGEWLSCLNLDTFISGETNNPIPGRLEGRFDGFPVDIEVAGCNDATLAIDFTDTGGDDATGCVSISFTSEDRDDEEQCGVEVRMDVDF